MIKIGDTFEVIKIIDTEYPTLYKEGDTGIIKHGDFYINGANALVGGKPSSVLLNSGWYVSKSCYKKIGRLTITKVK